LCVVNMSVIRHAYEVTSKQRNLSLRQIPAVVNGDDGLVRACPEFAPSWEETALVAGLVPSIGKVYSHDFYANINSTSFLFINEKFSLVKYVNMGLLMGLGRSGGKVSFIRSQAQNDYENSPFSMSIGARHHALMDSCPRNLRVQVHEQFLKHNADKLKEAHVPWYIPESLGGVGLKPLIRYVGDNIDETVRSYCVTSTGHVCGPSRVDVFCAYGLHDRVHKEFSVGKVPTYQPVQTRSIWQASVKRLDVYRSRVKISESDAGFLDTSTFYLVPSAVMKSLKYETVVSRIHTNQRVWASILKLHNDFSPSGDQLFLDV